MKILQINCVYGTGSTGRLTQAIHTRLLAEGVKSVVCCGRGPRSTDPHVHKVCGELYAKAQHAEADLTGLVYGGCVLSTARLLHILRRRRRISSTFSASTAISSIFSVLSAG